MEEISKEEIKKLMQIPGKGRGVTLKCLADYIREKKGEESVKLLEKEMGRMGYPVNFDKMKNLEWYPVGLRAAAFIVAKKIFNWGDEDIIDLGKSTAKFSFIVKLVMNYFTSVHVIFKFSPKHWKKHYNIGRLEAGEWGEKKNFATLRLKDFKVHPIFCLFLCGYFTQMTRLGGGMNVTREETKCVHEGDSFHEFAIRWE